MKPLRHRDSLLSVDSESKFERVLAPESVSHEVVDDEADLDEGVAVRLGHPVHHVAHQVLQRVGRPVLLQGEVANEVNRSQSQRYTVFYS